MERKIIPRTQDGRYESKIIGIEDFATKVAKELLSKFKDIDYFDLKTCFDLEFGFAYTMAMMEEEVANDSEGT